MKTTPWIKKNRSLPWNKLPWKNNPYTYEPISSAIDRIKYDKGNLFVKFVKGKTNYKFPNVPLMVFRNWRGSPSAGKYYHSTVKQYSTK